MDSRRAVLFLVLLFFLFTTPDPHPQAPLTKEELQKKIDEEQQALSFLNSSNYGDFDSQNERWLPLTGLTKDDGFAWGLLPEVQHRAREQLQSILQSLGILALEPLNSLSPDSSLTNLTLPVYRNVTGRVRGDWVRWKEPESANRPHLNMTSIAKKYPLFVREFGHNVTTDEGRLVIDFHERAEVGEAMSVNGVPVREIEAHIMVEMNDSLGETWAMTVFGLHFEATGAMVLTTSSDKFAGLMALPHMTLSRDSFEVSRQLLNRSLLNSLGEDKALQERYLPWASLSHPADKLPFPSPKCEYVVYLQQHPVIINNEVAQESMIGTIESELRFPKGTPIPDAPPMLMSASMFSPDCGFVLESKGSPAYAPSDRLYISGLKREEHSKYAKRFIVIVAGTFILQIHLLMRQMKESSTPSTRSRVSFFTIAMMSTGDYLFISFVLVKLWSEASWLLLIATSFLALFSISFLGMKFQIEIWTTQEPERRTTSSSSSSPPSSLPMPATVPEPRDTGATPITLPPDQDMPINGTPLNTFQTIEGGVSAGAMYTRFYVMLPTLFLLSSWAAFWPTRLAAIYANMISFIYLSFWSPQIYRNIMRNCRKAFQWEFVVGESILRVFPFIYIYLFPRNVLMVTLSSTEITIYVSWVWIQHWLLVSQNILGPRFFIPKSWLPPAYDYHPILRDASASGSGEDLESGDTLPVSSLRAEQRDVLVTSKEEDKPGSKDRKKKVFDCAICMQDIEVSITSTPGNGAGTSVAENATNILARRAYMVTPCRHIFHSSCLETWMRLRLQCPICRETIPPI
ncbi:hypothetical protein LOZ53_000880 [Ophidiomyces ophidiicola]|nr:hypothetical protein LOZ55_003555 [Ophidiomyces ophidiicola]KAI1985865.1 hypothetical protein LOZ51_006213 [Ophidiomyces ophidiicola]KAI1995308.1 hypothetical protein LOZ54_000622 [Ophidiomyces ophidiicola]KAI1997149.1 hypothetical protein LOZ53_000880 [Ophidiomyces ophidiicola]